MKHAKKISQLIRMDRERNESIVGNKRTENTCKTILFIRGVNTRYNNFLILYTFSS